MSFVVPSNRRLLSEKEISDYLLGKFFRCFKPFLSWMKKGESYWFEYQGNGTYCVRSDNNLGKSFSMEVNQLLTCFIPCKCEEDDAELIRHFHWLGELGIHHGDVDDYIKYKETQQQRS